MTLTDGHTFDGESLSYIAHLIDNKDIGIWEYHNQSKELKWSKGFYNMLGYSPGEIECSNNYFFDHLLYYQDKDAFIKATYSPKHDGPRVAHIRLLTKNQGYQWFESTTHRRDTGNGNVMYGFLTNINAIKLAQAKSAESELQALEIGRIAKIGLWEIDSRSMELKFSPEVYDIFELSNHIKLSVPEAIEFFLPQYRPLLEDAVNQALTLCKPYDIEVEFRTAKNNIIWVKCRAVPVLDEHGRCIILRGTFQDIDNIKRRGLTLQSSINLLDDQNKRLQNFAYIVSHNLRSHAGNLKFMVDLFEESDLQEDRTEIFQHIKTISQSLSSTMSHLEEIVRMQAEVSKGTKLVEFQKIYDNVTLALQNNIEASHAEIHVNFNEAPAINYVPAYLESILQNFLTNAIKYKHPNRHPVIHIATYKSGNNIYLVFDDNGLGIDLDRYGDQLFGMYKTFHQNSDSKGIGLFMTRNQIEALGGTINVESTVNVGTKFTVKLV
ncbi:PAS domain-containing sensor histidine kinase [Mucilaginibacter sp. 21P]|uniref:PAS domain-containing sensor histidine kinase n=1 Tax=Mucilaginibacter sp. 21P TaxID=2778902 RepID=UPI001C57A0CA|nr:PAS domain-containing sensor histidine kinase [Mucilaginibacter sp. 21P]QXV65296.1 PAS domain-containing sensor histidine kinase [Mucilaginibacter sp. 21P]